MILQNKKTGVLGVLEATTYHGGRPDNIVEVYEMGMGAVRVLWQYKTLEELLSEWEDYKPKVPRIEDEKVRRVVKTWAGLNAIKQAVYAEYESLDGNYCCLANMDDGRISVKFSGRISTLKDCEEYAIDELCGGEED